MKLMKKSFVAYQGERMESKQNAEGILKEVKLAVIRPNQRAQAKGQEIYNKKFAELLRAGTLVSVELDKEMKRRELWDDQKKAEFEQLTKKLADGETALLKGGIKKSEGRKLAIQMVRDRGELIRATSDRNVLHQNSAEGQSENSRFNYLIFNCTVFDDGDQAGQKYFKSYEDFLESDDVVIDLAGQALMNLMYDPVEAQKNLPEYRFLSKFHYINDKLDFINAEGKLTDSEGRLINIEGRYINEKGEFVDNEGKRVNDDGSPLVEFTEFLEG